MNRTLAKVPSSRSSCQAEVHAVALLITVTAALRARCTFGQSALPCSLSRTPWSDALPVGTVIKVIHEVDIALRSLIEREATDGTEVEVVFEAPTKDWASRRNVPTIDVYLYDIREDLRRRERGLINEYDDGDRVTNRHLPPRHFKLSYLVTAWTQRPEDEHRLLSALLSCFLRHDAIPQDLVTGPLAELGLPVPVTIALPPPEDRSFADVWSALGGELKPSLDVVVSAPTDTGQHYVAGPPVVAPPRVSLGGVGAWPPREARQQAAVAVNGRLVSGSATTERSAGGSRTGGQAGSADAAGPAAAGSRSAGDRTTVPADGSGSGGDIGAARGLSWTEFAGSASSPAPVGSPTGHAEAAGEPDDDHPATGATPAPPTRRRRQGGIGQR
jgi:hypothetical protein